MKERRSWQRAIACSLSTPKKMGQPLFPAALQLWRIMITALRAAPVRATESQGPGPEDRVSNYGYQSCFEVYVYINLSPVQLLHMQVTAKKGHG